MSKNLSQDRAPDGARVLAVRHRRRAGSVAVVVVALHGAVLWLLDWNVGPHVPWRPPRAAADAVVRADPVPMTWVTAVPSAVAPLPVPQRQPERPSIHAPVALADPPRPDRPAPAPRATGAMPSTPHASRSASGPDRAPSATESSMSSEAMPAAVPTDAASPEAPSPGASPVPMPVPLQRTLRKEALRELSAGGRVWQDDARLASKPPDSADARLASGMAASARSDCLRGGFKGADMGLLSLPMMGLAAVQGRCRMP